MLLHCSESPSPHPKPRSGAEKLLTKALRRSIRIFTSPCKGNTGDSKGSQKCLRVDGKQSQHSSASQSQHKEGRGDQKHRQIQQCLGNEQRGLQSRAAHIHQLEPQGLEQSCTEPIPTARTHRVMIRVHVGHKHSHQVTQHLINLLSIVPAQLSKGSFPTVQEQGPGGTGER